MSTSSGLIRRRATVAVVVTAVIGGYGLAAAADALAQPELPAISDYGPGDGLTRFVVSATTGEVTPELLTTLEAVPGVDSAQPLDDGTALVAAAGLGVQELRAVAGVASVEFSQSGTVFGSATDLTDPYAKAYGWNLENDGSNAYDQPATAGADVNATTGWGISEGAGTVVAVVDTGFDSDHPDLLGTLWTNPSEACGSVDTNGNGLAGDCHGWNFTTNTADIDNGPGGVHGIGVAGVIVAQRDNGVGIAGLAPRAKVMPLVVGSGPSMDANLAAKAIRYAADNGATVITASWGGTWSGSVLTNLRSAIAYAASKNVLVIAAAGNDSGNRDTNLLQPASLADPNVITVGSSNAMDAMASSSAFGASSVDLFAPGHKIAALDIDGDYGLVSGTSAAAPHVAAAVLQYVAVNPGLSYTAVRAKILSAVTPVPAFAGRSVTGGRLDLSKLAPPSATPTPAPPATPAPVTPPSASYTFASMNAPVGTVTPRIVATAPAGTGYSVQFALGMEFEGTVYALSGKPVTLNGRTVSTDDEGLATFPLGVTTGVTTLSPTTSLGAGRYVLSVQLVKDGVAVGREYGAPLLVGQPTPSPTVPGTAPIVPPTTPGTSPTTPGTPTPGSRPGVTPTSPGTSPGTAPTGPTTPGGSTPGTTPTPPGTTPAPTGPVVLPGTSPAPVVSPTTPGGAAPGTTPTNPVVSPPSPGTTPGTSPAAPAPGTGTPTPGTPTPGVSNPGTGGGTAPSPGGTGVFPPTGGFGLTSMTPNRVSTSGGTSVTITGASIPANPRVRVGDTSAATVTASTATTVTFTAPRLVAGVYDVSVFSVTGESSRLPAALTYVPGTNTPVVVPSNPGTNPGTSPGSTPVVAPSNPGTSPGTTPVVAPANPGPIPGSGPVVSPGSGTAGPVVRSGPAGERLVQTARFTALRPALALSCTSSCSGMTV